MSNSQAQVSSNRQIRFSSSKILSIARSSKLTDLLTLELSHEGYEVEAVHDCMSGLLQCRAKQPQLVILDWQISDFAAADLCYRLKSYNYPVSIIVLDTSAEYGDRNERLDSTASINYRIAALDAGADDCLSFPFAINEFLARIRVQMRKHQVSQPSVLQFEDLRLDRTTREVYRGDRYIYLTTKEFALLECLLIHARQVMSRNCILDRIWGCDYVGDSNIIEVYVRYLRLKLEANNAKRLIYTVRGVGYVLRESSFY